MGRSITVQVRHVPKAAADVRWRVSLGAIVGFGATRAQAAVDLQVKVDRALQEAVMAARVEVLDG